MSEHHSQEIDIAHSIESSKQFEVSLIDSLGEGEGCFDSDSRYEFANGQLSDLVAVGVEMLMLEK